MGIFSNLLELAKLGSDISLNNGSQLRVSNYDSNGNNINDSFVAFGYYENETFGKQVNQDGLYSGTPDTIYDENIEWTMSAVVGAWNFDSLTNPFNGTKCIDGTLTADGDIAQALRGTPIDLSNYVAISGQIRIEAIGAVDDLQIYAWDTVGASIIGNSVNISDYVEITTLNEYQAFNIPLADMGIETETISAIRFEVVDTNPPFKFRLDYIRVQEAGGNLAYTVPAPSGFRLEILETTLSIISSAAYTGKIDPLTILGLTLTNPIVFQLGVAGTVLPTGAFGAVDDWVEQGFALSHYGDDTSTAVQLRLQYPKPIILNSATNDFVRLLNSDNLGGLAKFTVSYAGNLKPLP